MLRVYEHLSRGSTNRRRLIVEKFLALKIAVPSDLDVELARSHTLQRLEERHCQVLRQFGGSRKLRI